MILNLRIEFTLAINSTVYYHFLRKRKLEFSSERYLMHLNT